MQLYIIDAWANIVAHMSNNLLCIMINVDELENLVLEIYNYIEVVRDSCEKNDYFSQSFVLDKALENLEQLQEFIFST